MRVRSWALALLRLLLLAAAATGQGEFDRHQQQLEAAQRDTSARLGAARGEASARLSARLAPVRAVPFTTAPYGLASEAKAPVKIPAVGSFVVACRGHLDDGTGVLHDFAPKGPVPRDFCDSGKWTITKKGFCALCLWDGEGKCTSFNGCDATSPGCRRQRVIATDEQIKQGLEKMRRHRTIKPLKSDGFAQFNRGETYQGVVGVDKSERFVYCGSEKTTNNVPVAGRFGLRANGFGDLIV